MAGNDDFYDDDGFVGYLPTTVDPGNAMLIATIAFCCLTNALLPCLVSLGRRYERKRMAARTESERNDNDGLLSEQPQGADILANANAANTKTAEDSMADADADLDQIRQKQDEESVGSSAHKNYMPNSYVRGDQKKSSTWVSLLDQIIMPPYPDEGGSLIGGSALVGANSRPPPVSELTAGMEGDNRSALTNMTANTNNGAASSSFWETNILDAGFGTRTKSRGVRRQRRVLRDQQLRRRDNTMELEADRKEYRHSLVITDSDGVEHGGMTASEMVGMPYTGTGKSEVASRVSGTHTARGGRRRRNQRGGDGSSALSGTSGAARRRARGEGSALGSAISGRSGMSRRRGHSPEPSILSQLDNYVISPNDAADADDPGFYILPKPGIERDQDIDLCCGKRAWYKPAVWGGAFDRVVHLAEWDHEMKRIVKLCVPYSITALLEGIVDTITVALVANYIGTEAVAAYTIVALILGLTSEFLSGILATEATLCSHAIGSENFKLAGQYVQICALLFTILFIPNILVWSFLTDDVILLFGFNENTARMGQEYAIVLLFHEWLVGFSYAFHGLLNVIGYENFATFIGVTEGIVSVCAIAALVVTRDTTTLQEVGLINLAIGVIFFLFTVWYAICKGWMNEYLEGMVGSFAMRDKQTLRNVVSTAVPLAFGYLLEYGEWEVLTIFVAHLGPAEVAAWGILGSLWETFETLSKGIADGGEVRCAYHLGNANPGMAKISAHKVILLSVAVSFFFTSFIFMMGEDLATWFTPDPTLQHLIADLLPLLGVGNIALTAGSVSWALVGAQARYRLATLVALVASWGVTMPVAAVFTYGFNLSLQGVTSAVVVGYSVTCTALFYIILRSDWERISKHVVELNADEYSESSSEIEPAAHREDGIRVV